MAASEGSGGENGDMREVKEAEVEVEEEEEVARWWG